MCVSSNFIYYKVYVIHAKHNIILLFIFHTLYEFRLSDSLICAKWHWVVTRQPPWCDYHGINSTHHCHHGFCWLKVWRFLFAMYTIWILKNYVNALIAHELSGFTCTCSLTMNLKFSWLQAVLKFLVHC